jgi:putative heme transporter
MRGKKLKLTINIVMIIGIVALVYASRHQVMDAFRKLIDLNYFWLFMIIPLQIGNYTSVAKFYQTYLRNLGEKVHFGPLFKIALEMNFVNSVLPSGGVSGFGYFGMRMGSEGVSTSKATLTQVMRHTLTFIAFIVYMSVALIILSLFGDVSRFMILVSSSVISFILIGTSLIIYMISSASRIKNFMAFLPRAINKVSKAVLRGHAPRINIEKIESLFGQLHLDYLKIHRDWRSLKWPFFWTLMMNLTELMTIMVVYFAFGQRVNFGAIIIAYAVANIAGLVAVVPGGVGVYEGLMTAVLAGAGIPKALALSATLVYRVLNMALFLPIGFVLYQIAQRRKQN